MDTIKRRFEMAWKRACAEHARLTEKYGYSDLVPTEEWATYERLQAAAKAIAEEAGPAGSPEWQAVVYG